MSTDIDLENQVFDLVFHPKENILFAALLTGDIKAFNYVLPEPGEEEIVTSELWSARPTNRSCRGLALSEDAKLLFSVGKERSLHSMDVETGAIVSVVERAHDAPINRIRNLNASCLATGDDDGVVKLWDPRVKPSPIASRAYTHHWDYITDFCYFPDKHQLVTTSGDATLSLIDIRSSKAVPLTVSESQDDELLSAVPIKGGTKILTGSSLGILSVWDRSRGLRDCVDRIPGHPHSIETIVPLSDDVVATGSSDGMVRIVSILPSKLMGVIAHHNEFPIERLALSHDNAILGSASHDECVKLTDVRDIFDPSDDEEDHDEVDSDDEDVEMAGKGEGEDEEMDEEEEEEEEEEAVEPSPEPEPVQERRKKKRDKPKNQDEMEKIQRGDFFGDL